VPEITFADLGLAPELLRAVLDEGYTKPTPIQAQAIPLVISGKDIMGGAQTGTGKTAAFTLPILQRILPFASQQPVAGQAPGARPDPRPDPRTGHAGLRVGQVLQQAHADPRHVRLRRRRHQAADRRTEEGRRNSRRHAGPPARPRREQERQLQFVQALVLDEADRMLDMGFVPDVTRILNMLPAQRQSLLFSATFSEEIKKLADTMLKSPVLIEVARRNQVSDTITHRVHPVSEYGKRGLLTKLLKSGESASASSSCAPSRAARA
jgi:ATP-dependent RNA helicase RhlE